MNIEQTRENNFISNPIQLISFSVICKNNKNEIFQEEICPRIPAVNWWKLIEIDLQNKRVKR